MSILTNKFLLIYQGKVICTKATYQEALDEGSKRFGTGSSKLYGRKRRVKYRANGKWFIHEAIIS